jgi:hypothetical protein
MDNPETMATTLLRISEVVAILAILCRLIPKEYGMALAVSPSLHVGLVARVFLPLTLLSLSGFLSTITIALIMSCGRLMIRT